ncbi:hypothetical protein PHYBOEH_008551 [Phytophthora boehmeriae]|uniref:Uncharacterized protein n=1 Tax=Phytophthora boehmeriae TaxID=109152 RepID=A0A8T1X1H6_9STRA|nr:hypothetical protein PHYBOEH_008551 [Phytophthora boehmeriae]
MAANPADALKRLRELKHDACEEKLETIGVTNAEDMHVLLTNLFAFQTEQREIALHEVLQEAQEFRNPPHAVRTKQVACTLELENAVKETSKADAKCNNAAALLDEHKRELATRLRQFATQQEPKEISAVHSLHSFRLIDQLNVAREMFLEQFPGLDARALAFVSSLEENRITRWQLQRFFEAHTTVSEVKHNMKELTFFMHETEVKKHNYSRFGQCADALQFGHERLAELLDISLEVLVLGIDRTDVTKRKLLDRIVLGAILDARNARGNDDKARIWCKGASTLGKMNAAAITLQSLWRRRAGKKLVAELRANRRHQELRKQYITELRTDHVTPIWQAERKKEQEDLDAWLKGEAKAHRMRVLYNILRYPYVEEWDDNAQTYVYAMYSQQNTSKKIWLFAFKLRSAAF